MGRKKKPKRAARRAKERPEKEQDPRLIASEIREDGEGWKKGDWVLGVSPVDLSDGRTVIWPSPQPVAFNLVEAKRFARKGAKARRRIMSQLETRPTDGRYSPPNRSATIDAIRDLQNAVLFAFTAVESLANHAIDRLIEEKGEGVEVERLDGTMISGQDLVLRFRLDEKFKRILPLLDGGKNIAGSAAWEDYLGLKSLRDELVHVKRRGINSDPTTPTAYDRLLIGEGDDCAERALQIIDCAWEGFLPPLTRRALT